MENKCGAQECTCMGYLCDWIFFRVCIVKLLANRAPMCVNYLDVNLLEGPKYMTQP